MVVRGGGRRLRRAHARRVSNSCSAPRIRAFDGNVSIESAAISVSNVSPSTLPRGDSLWLDPAKRRHSARSHLADLHRNQRRRSCLTVVSQPPILLAFEHSGGDGLPLALQSSSQRCQVRIGELPIGRKSSPPVPDPLLPAAHW